jgi:hypothetical protein
VVDGVNKYHLWREELNSQLVMLNQPNHQNQKSEKQKKKKKNKKIKAF